MLPDALVPLAQSFQRFHRAEVVDIRRVKVDFDHVRIIAIIKQSEESFTRREEKRADDLVNLRTT